MDNAPGLLHGMDLPAALNLKNDPLSIIPLSINFEP